MMYLMYLIRKNKARTAHLWNGADTACRMASTGGLNKSKYRVVEQTTLPMCTMCENKKKAGKIQRPKNMHAHFQEEMVAAARAEFRAAALRDIPTTTEVWHALTKFHQNDLVVFSTLTDLSGGRIETTWGLRGAATPLIHCRTTWDATIDSPSPLDERHEYWLKVSDK